MPAGRWRPWTIVGFLWVAYCINYTDRQLVFSQFPVLSRELGFTAAELGWIGTAFLWAYSLTSPIAGRLADRFRLEWFIPASVVLWSLATVGTGLSRTVSGFLVWRGMIGVTEGLYFPAAVAVIGSVHSGLTRSRAIAIHGTAQFAGSIAGGWFGGWSAEHWSWRAGFFLLGALGVLYAPLLRWGVGVVPKRAGPGGERCRFSEVLRQPRFQGLSLVFFLLCAILWMLYAWLPTLVHERFRLSLTDSGFLATAWLQASSAAGILGGGVIGDWCARRWAGGRFQVVAGGLLIASPWAYLTVIAPSLPVFKLAAAGFGLFAGMMMANVVASAYDITDPGNYGFAAGVLTLLGGLSGGLSMLSVGQWKDTLGVQALMGCVAVAGVASALLLAGICTGTRASSGPPGAPTTA